MKDHTCGGKIFSPHASDCHKYYLCQFGVPIEQTCPDGLYWNKVNCKLIDSKLPVVAVIGRNVSYQVLLCVLLLSERSTWLCRHRGEMEVELLPSYNLPLEGGGDQHHTPTALPKGKTRYPSYWRMVGLGASLESLENLAPTGIQFPIAVCTNDRTNSE